MHTQEKIVSIVETKINRKQKEHILGFLSLLNVNSTYLHKTGA